MTFNTKSILELSLRSVSEPREVARDLMALNIPHTALWPALGVVVLLSTVLSGGLNMLSPASGGPLAELMNRPFLSAFMTFGALVLTIFGLHWAGRMFGGKGRLGDMILVMTWFQAVLFVAQIALVLVTLALPPLGALLFLGFIGVSFWMAVAFVDAVHHFESYFKAFGVIMFALVAIAFGLSIMLSLMGVGAEGVVGNV
ncbi:Yip1 family protein [Primorskyibacter sp. S187A]|uniref:Yip1 family protein n=1 Tax=Primorskyibacter sp. S187A TaxID=3415130 RepID=UPI003C7CDFB4